MQLDVNTGDDVKNGDAFVEAGFALEL